MTKKQETMTVMETGATRSSDTDKPDYLGYLCPIAFKMFGEYMLRHQTQADGTKRASDNWKKGMPLDRYMSSKTRHDIELWRAWEAYKGGNQSPEIVAIIEEEISACFFNVQGFMREWRLHSGTA